MYLQPQKSDQNGFVVLKCREMMGNLSNKWNVNNLCYNLFSINYVVSFSAVVDNGK